MSRQSIVNFWSKLTGQKSVFGLEGLLFHSVCILALLSIGLNALFNYLIGIPELALLMLIALVAVSVIYYLSRFKRQTNTGIGLFQIVTLVLLIVNYYYNSGINGPSYVIFVLCFFVTVAIVPQKQYWFWVAVNVIFIVALLWVEYAHPNWIKITYNDKVSRFLDFGYTYIVTASLVLLVTTYIRKAYHAEHHQVQQKAEALETSNHTKDKLLSILAHDLKEPLSSIQGFLELLTDYKLEETERISIEKELLTRTKDASYMLANILSWTKTQMEAVKVNLIPLSLLHTLGDTLDVLKSIALEKGIELNYQLTDDICITGDKDMLQLVIRNLVVNAIKFTYPGGRINISTDVNDGRCIIKIADTGAGIPLTRQASIFSLATKSTYGTGKEKGAGLGLVLCHEFVELQGGRIWFTSHEQKGSTFYVSMALHTDNRSQAKLPVATA